MADSRTKNASRNIVFGSLNKIVTLALPFFTRTLILYLLGASYLGIGTLFTSILSFLSLAELGLGSAIVYAMYRPIAENNYQQLCALLNYYRRLYRYIGVIILSIGTLIIPLVPFLMKGEAPPGINIYFLYYIYLVNSVISYFFAGYRQSLLSAYQRADIISNIATVISLFIQFGQIFVLYFTKNFYIYAFIPIIGTLITNGTNSFITKRKYPDIICKGEISKDKKNEIKRKLAGLFGTKLNSIIVHSADIMVISAFLGLTMTAQYGNYYYIMNAVCGFIAVFFSSLTAGIGNKLVTDTKSASMLLFENLSFTNAWLVGWCSVCFLCLYEPFMEIWVGKNLCLGLPFVICMVFYFFIYEIQRTVLTFKDAAGLWNKDKYRPYVSMTVNVVSNLILVNIIGIYGIVISTIIAFFISLPWANYVLFKYLFKKNPMDNILRIIQDFSITLACCVITYIASMYIPQGIGWFFIRIMICLILPNTVFYFAYRNKKEFSYVKNMLLSRIGK